MQDGLLTAGLANPSDITMRPIAKFTPVLLISALFLAACGGGSGGVSSAGSVVTPPGTPASPSGAPAPQGSFAAASAGTRFPFAAHRGLEIVDIYNDNLTNSLVSNPAAALVKSDSGFDLAVDYQGDGPGGASTWSFDTRPGASDILGPQHYSITPACTQTCGTMDVVLTSGATSNLDYATYGLWSYSSGVGFKEMSQAGVFAGGVATTQMPTTGTATYTGGVAGVQSRGIWPENTFKGSLSLTANFAANTISGAATGLVTDRIVSSITSVHPPPGLMNDIVFTGGTISGNGFAGAAATAALSAVTSIDVSNAAGTFGGTFYGPGAVEAAGSFALTGAVGSSPPAVDTIGIIGSFGAHR